MNTDLPPVPPSERRFLFGAGTNKEILQLIKQAVPELHEEGDEVGFGNFNR